MLTPDSPSSFRRWIPFLFLILLAVAPLVAKAAEGPSMTAAPASVVHPKIDTGVTAWMLVSSALVLLMVPGLALFYGGMVRAKNVLNMFLCVMVAIGVIGLHWVIIGYALTFGGESLIKMNVSKDISPLGFFSFLGWDSTLLFLRAFRGHDVFRQAMSGDTLNAVKTGVPELAFVMFQGKFAIITPALIVGAVAERVRFGPFIIFMLLWSTLVYCPVAHCVWSVNGWLFQWGVLDFAGGTVVHVLAGVSALALCLVIGPRKGYGRIAMPPHSLGLTLIGAGLLWFGWFGFNAGSSIAIPGNEEADLMGISALAFANTQVAAAAAATAWMLIEWWQGGMPTILGFASGMVAGLVVITPCAGHVEPSSAIIIGGLGGAVCFFGCRIKSIFKYDDSLDAFGVHGIGGALGAVLVGFFVVRPVAAGSEQVFKQTVGMLSAAAYAFIISYGLGLILHKTIGLRVTGDQEEEGLDITIHGETGYNLSDSLGSYVEEETVLTKA